MLDTILFAAITAFLKEQFGLTGKVVVMVAIAVGSLFWFQADIAALSPIAGSILEYLKFIVAAPGLFDLVTNVVKVGSAVTPKSQRL